jgi:hypothetical protein
MTSPQEIAANLRKAPKSSGPRTLDLTAHRLAELRGAFHG